MAYDRHRAGARGEALAVAWLTNRDWYVFTAWQSQSPCDLVAVKLRGVARAEIMLLEVRYVGPNSTRPEGRTAAQKRSGIKLMVVNYDGQIDLDPDWSKTVTRKDRSARAKARRDDDTGE